PPGALRVLQRTRAHRDDLVGVGQARLGLERAPRDLDRRRTLLVQPGLARLFEQGIGVGRRLGGAGGGLGVAGLARGADRRGLRVGRRLLAAGGQARRAGARVRRVWDRRRRQRAAATRGRLAQLDQLLDQLVGRIDFRDVVGLAPGLDALALRAE